LAGRSKVAAIDVLQALEELGVGGVGELHEWAVGLDQEVSLSTPGLATLGEDVREGLGVEEPLAEMKLVPNSQIPKAEMDIDSEEEEEGEEDEDVDMVDEEPYGHANFARPIRFKSPDFSWLPPLPGDVDAPPEIAKEALATTAAAAVEEHAVAAEPAPSLSIIDRYRRRIPFSQSQLAASRPFVDPPAPPLTKPLPPATTSFPALAAAFAATKGEPSIALRQTPLRHQASELLRRTIASPDEYTPEDTLFVPMAGPRSTPIIPSHSLTDSIQPHPIPLNSNPGLLSKLVHTIHSPHLPPELRNRLTSIRPPVPQVQDGEPILYGEPVRGPSEAALLRAKGKIADAETADQGLLQATWQVPLRGADKWRRPLPTGSKVVQSGKGEDKPRRPPGAKPPGTPSDAGAAGGGVVMPREGGGEVIQAGTPGPGTTGKIRLRLGAGSHSGEMLSPGAQTPTGSTNLAPPATAAIPGGLSPSAPSMGATSPGASTGLKIKLGLPKTPSSEAIPSTKPLSSGSTKPPSSAENSQNRLMIPGSVSPMNGTSTSAAPKPTFTLKFGSRSVSPNKPDEGQRPTSTDR